MIMKNQDKLEYASELIHGMKNLCQLLSCPNVPPITAEILIVFECVFDKTMELISETFEDEYRKILDDTGENR